MINWLKRNKKGLALGTAICIGAVLYALPFSPWVKQEIVETAKVITFNEGSCVVETSSGSIINITECDSKMPGEEVTIKYRAETTLGELVT